MRSGRARGGPMRSSPRASPRCEAFVNSLAARGVDPTACRTLLSVGLAHRFQAPRRRHVHTLLKEFPKMSLRDPLRAASVALVVFAVSAAVIGTAVAAGTTPAAPA